MKVKTKKVRVKKVKVKTIQEIIESENVDMDPRKHAFSLAYFDPGSSTYSNATQSAIKAGFSAEYADNITSLAPKWLSELMGKFDMMEIVRKNIKKHLEIETRAPIIGMHGPVIDKETKKLIYAEDPKLLKIQQDMTIWVAEKTMGEYKKATKEDKENAQPVFITQIIIKSPDGNSIIYDTNNTSGGNIRDAETSGSVQ